MYAAFVILFYWRSIFITSTYIYAGVPKYILISVHDYNLPPFLLESGYFTGKRKAESEVLSRYPNAGNELSHYHFMSCCAMLISLPPHV